MSDTKVRKSVTLNPEDEARLKRVSHNHLCLTAIKRLYGDESVRSEASVLRALVVAGLDHLDEQIAEAGYAELAASQNGEDREFHAAMRSSARRRA